MVKERCETSSLWPEPFTLSGNRDRDQAPTRSQRKTLTQVAEDIDQCRLVQGCGSPPCSSEAVGKPTHQVGTVREILVVGEAPAAEGWWASGRAFYRSRPGGRMGLSRTGANLNRCLAVLGTCIEEVSFAEAVKCRPAEPGNWHPGERVRQHCRRFLSEQLSALRPRLVLPLGRTATTSCLELASAGSLAAFGDAVGKPYGWVAPWGHCWILPLYHPSPANNARWPANERFLRQLVRRVPSLATLDTAGT